jgi:hypothetical protein
MQEAELAARATENFLASPSSSAPAVKETPTFRLFHARLAAANARSQKLNSRQYAIYTRAREAGFTATKALSLKFATLASSSATASPLTSSVLEILAYLAYDRLCSVVEAANRVHFQGVLTQIVDAPIPVSAYVPAIASMRSLPEELQELVDKAKAALEQKRERERINAAHAALIAASPPPEKREDPASRTPNSDFAMRMTRAITSSLSGSKRSAEQMSASSVTQTDADTPD